MKIYGLFIFCFIKIKLNCLLERKRSKNSKMQICQDINKAKNIKLIDFRIFVVTLLTSCFK